MAIFPGGIEFPGLHAFNGFLIQAHAQRAHYPGAIDPPINTHDDGQHHHALILRFTRFFRKFRFGSIDGARSAYSVAHMIDSWANSRPASSGADAPAAAAAHSTAYASSVRRRHELGKRIADLSGLGHVQIGNYRGLDHQLALLRRQYRGRSELLFG